MQGSATLVVLVNGNGLGLEYERLRLNAIVCARPPSVLQHIGRHRNGRSRPCGTGHTLAAGTNCCKRLRFVGLRHTAGPFLVGGHLLLHLLRPLFDGRFEEGLLEGFVRRVDSFCGGKRGGEGIR